MVALSQEKVNGPIDYKLRDNQAQKYSLSLHPRIQEHLNTIFDNNREILLKYLRMEKIDTVCVEHMSEENELKSSYEIQTNPNDGIIYIRLDMADLNLISLIKLILREKVNNIDENQDEDLNEVSSDQRILHKLFGGENVKVERDINELYDNDRYKDEDDTREDEEVSIRITTTVNENDDTDQGLKILGVNAPSELFELFKTLDTQTPDENEEE